MASASPITNVTLPEGTSLPQYHHMPFQYFSPLGMDRATFDAMQNSAIQNYLPPQQPPMMFAAKNPVVPSVQAEESNETSQGDVVSRFNEKDVLLGRGGHANHHAGNKMLLERVKMFQPTYKAYGGEDDGKKKKNDLTRELVRWVQAQGGRFLKRTSKDVPWREVSYNEARMKVSHLFRNDHTPEGRERKRKRYATQKNGDHYPDTDETEKTL